jgi:N-acetylglutamate synthase-like GNAT family acetyltransferase
MSAILSESRLAACSYLKSDLLCRSFRELDQSAGLELLHTGILVGHIDPIDATSEVVSTEEEYLSRAKDHFWVAEVNGSVVGTIAVTVDRLGVAHIRRLWVAPAWQPDARIAASLVRLAAAHALESECLELIFYTPVNGVRAIEFVRQLGFRFGANRTIAGMPVVGFYTDLHPVPVATKTEQEGDDRDAAVPSMRRSLAVEGVVCSNQ